MAQEKKRKGLKAPHPFVLLFALIMICVVATYFVPAGQFERAIDENTGRTVVVAGSYERVEPAPIGPFQAFVSIQKGLLNAASIVLFCFFVYASFYTVLQTKALHAFIGSLLRILKGKVMIVIPVVMLVFGIAATTFGMYEESYGFIPLFVGLAIAMGFDAVVGLAMVSLAIGCGYAAAFINPFTVTLAQKIAGVPLLSGMQFRMVAWVLFMALGIAWTMRYAMKIKKDPTKSHVYGVDMGYLALDYDELVDMPFTGRAKVILLIVAATVFALVWGVMTQGWYLNEIVGLFIIMGISSAVVAGWRPNEIAKTYVEGCREITFGAMVIGLSRGILIVLNDGMIIDTVIHSLALPLASIPNWLAAEGMLFVQTLINFLIPSGSGQAATTMPIMAPLSDLIGVTRQVAVLAYQFGDGFSNLLWPTASVPIICAIAKIPMTAWWKFYIPFFVLIVPVQMVFMAAAVLTGLN